MRCAALWLTLIVCPAGLAGEIHSAVRSGDLDRVKALLASGCDPSERDQLGSTPLHDAAWNGDTAIIDLLLRNGADLEARHAETGSSPLHYAVITNHKEAVALLLDRG